MKAVPFRISGALAYARLWRDALHPKQNSEHLSTQFLQELIELLDDEVLLRTELGFVCQRHGRRSTQGRDAKVHRSEHLRANQELNQRAVVF